MSTFTKPNDFTAGTTIDAEEVDANFDSIFTAMNDDLVHLDGTTAMTGLLVLPGSDPTSDNQATRKAYVDAKAGGIIEQVTWFGGSGESVAAGADYGTWYGITGSLEINDVDLVADRWYRAKLQIPELFTNKDVALGVEPPVYAGIEVDGTVHRRMKSMHAIGSGSNAAGYGVDVEYVFKATATETVDFVPKVRHEAFQSGDTATIKITSFAATPVSFYVEDLGTGA